MGRVGADAPVDNVVATLIPVIGGVAFPLVLPFAHRFGKRALVRGVLVMTAVTAVSMAYFAGRDVYDEMHQKRMFVLRLENVGYISFVLSVSDVDLTLTSWSDHVWRASFAFGRFRRGARVRGVGRWYCGYVRWRERKITDARYE